MKNLIGLLFLASFMLFALISFCENDSAATINIEEAGNGIEGYFAGNSGSKTHEFIWKNNSAIAEYKLDISAANAGSIVLIITDTNGNVVTSQTLQKGQGDDSISGVTRSGTGGNWTITVTLTNFNGDGSFSIIPGT